MTALPARIVMLALAIAATCVVTACGGGEGETRTVTETVQAEPPRDTTVAVPGVEGLPLSRARRALDRAGLRARTRRKNSDADPGTVLRQEPGEGVRVDRGASVELVVAKRRPAPTTVACGDLVESGAGTYDVRATGLDCETAIIVARQWEDECASATDGSCEVTLGFACTYEQLGIELGGISCVSGDRKVEFQTGA